MNGKKLLLCSSILLLHASFAEALPERARETWVPDWSHGRATALSPKEFSCDRVRCWSQDWQRKYKLDWHHPMINVRVKNLTDHDGIVAMKGFVTKLGEDGSRHSLGERCRTKVTVKAGGQAEALLEFRYPQFAERDPALGKDKAAKGKYLIELGPSADDVRGTWELELVEDVFFEYPPVPERKVKPLELKGPHCVFKPTPTPCEDFLRRYYGKLSQADYTLLDRAVRTFEWNALGKSCQQKIYVNPAPWGDLRAVNPSSAWFKGVWNWDSAFIMMATRRWDPELARDQMRLWMLIQTEDGMYPDGWTEGDGIQFPPSIGNSKPPVFGWATWQLHKSAPDRGFLREAYASLARNCAWWKKNRYDAKFGLYHYDGPADEPESKRRDYAGWESGWDDSPRWDGEAWHVLAVDLNAFLVLQLRALRDFAEELGLPDEAKGWAAEAKTLERAIEAGLWDEAGRAYYDRNFVTGAFNRRLTPASYMPLLIGSASQDRADAMAEKAWHLEPGWPSVAYDDPKYDPMGYWRGRTWLNVAYMALKGLAFYGHQEIANRGKKTLFSWIRNDPSAIYETYNSRTGLPCGASHFSWSCTFVIAMLLDWEMPRYLEMPAGDPEDEVNPAWVIRSYWMDGYVHSVSLTKTKKYAWKCPGDGKYDVTAEIIQSDSSVFTGRLLLNGRELAKGTTVNDRSLGIISAELVDLKRGDVVEFELAGTEKEPKKVCLDAFAVRRHDTFRTKTLSVPDAAHALPRRRHQGIPSVAVSKGGRLWATWYANVNGCETAENFAVLATSTDDGATWKEVLVCDPDATGLRRAFDPEIWVTPDDRLFWTWSERRSGIYAFGLQRWSGCGADPKDDVLMGVYLDAEKDPDPAALPEPFEIAKGVMMCKPVARKDGSWLLPVAHWYADPSTVFYESRDRGRTFSPLGGISVPEAARTYDETNVAELDDGTLRAWLRTAGHHGIPGMMESVSKDGGKTWTGAERGKVPQCSSRIFVTRLKNGHLVMVKNGPKDAFTDRVRLTAILSRDGGETWEGGLLLDERRDVSYPDGCEMADGSVMVVYDHERTVDLEVMASRFTEEEILKGGKARRWVVSSPGHKVGR